MVEYYGESGQSGFQRMLTHEQAISGKSKNNAFHKHLQIHHPERVGDMSVFKIKVEQTFQKSLERQVFEGTLINNTKSDILLNSKSEFHQPAVTRTTTTRVPGN